MTFFSNCGADDEDDQKFCPECGMRLKAEQTSVSPPPPPSPAGSQNNIPPLDKGYWKE